MVSVPLNVPITPDNVEVPMDSTVRLKSPLIELDEVRVAPVSIWISVAVPNVTAPDIVVVPLVTRRAPLEPTPVPDNVSGSANAVSVPESSSAAPLVNVVTALVAPSPSLLETATTPAVMLVVPLYVLVPESESVPAPFLVSVPVVVSMAPLIAIVPEPSTVRFFPAPPTELERVSVPESDCTWEWLVKVIAPLNVLLPLVLRITPVAEEPVPAIDSASVSVMPPLTDNAPVEVIDVEPADVPSHPE